MPWRHVDHQLKTLRYFAFASVLIPLAVALLFGAYRFHEAKEESGQQTERTLRVASEHASKILVITESLQDRIGDQVSGRAATDLKADEARLHAMLASLIRGQEQIRSLWILGPKGQVIASSRMFPVPVQNLSDREYFKFHRQEAGRRHMSDPVTGRGSGESLINFSMGFVGPDGRFGGVINVGLATAYMTQFYADLAMSEADLAVAMFNKDGAIYARWPAPTAGAERMTPESPLMRAIADGQQAGRLRGQASDGKERLIAYRKVADAYPLYVGAGAGIGALWFSLWKDFAVLLALGLPPFAALWFAMRAAAKRVRLAAGTARRLDEEMASRRKAEDALVQTQKLEALGRVAGGVAHEFNNALMVVSTNLHLLSRERPESSKRLESARKAVDSATKLTRQLLSFTRRQALAPQEVDPNVALPAIAPLLAPILGARVEMEMDLEPGLPLIRIDTAELELALVNLAINSRDAMPEGGRFSMSARKVVNETGDVSGVEIEVADTGVGIAPDVLPKVFEPFFTTKEVGSGTGLGLSQVRAFCERVGGHARVESEAEQGVKVTLFLPAVVHIHSVMSDAPKTEWADAAGKKVLLVEDDDLVAEALMPMLESFGYEVNRVDRAAKALSWLDGGQIAPDIVVSDVRMPGAMDGLGLARELKKTRPALPLLLITGYADALGEIERESFTVLPKPCAPEALRTAMEKLAA